MKRARRKSPGIDPRRHIRHFSMSTNKLGENRYYVTYDSPGFPSHAISREDYLAYQRRK